MCGGLEGRCDGLEWRCGGLVRQCGVLKGRCGGLVQRGGVVWWSVFLPLDRPSRIRLSLEQSEEVASVPC